MPHRSRTLVTTIVIIAVVLLLGFVVRQRRLHRAITTPTPIHSTSAVGPGDYENALTMGTLSRRYKIHVPQGYSGTTPMPVVVYLHGGGGSSDAAQNDGLFSFSDTYGFLLVAPDGTGILHDKLLTWNGGSWTASGGGTTQCCGYAVERNVDDVAFIDSVIKDVEAKFSVDTDKIFATGISNGGLMSFRLGCDLSETFAAIAPVASPGVPNDCAPERLVPALYIHGTSDPCALYNGGIGGGCIGKQKLNTLPAKTSVENWRDVVHNTSNGESAYHRGKADCTLYPGGTSGADVEFCTITDGGHTWPSGNQYLPEDKVGPVSYDLSFDQIWEFFKNHPKQK